MMNIRFNDAQRNDRNNSNQTTATTTSNSPPIAAVASSTLSDIVYVPMVKEDFLKRECKKLENPGKPYNYFEMVIEQQGNEMKIFFFIVIYIGKMGVDIDNK